MLSLVWSLKYLLTSILYWTVEQEERINDTLHVDVQNATIFAPEK